MTLSYRRRAAMVMVGTFVAIPVLASAAANAASPAVTFTGKPMLNLGTLSCPSAPNFGSLDVTAGAVVDFVNQTGKSATLWVGNSRKSLPDKSLVPVTFTQGPAQISVSMLPDCALDLGAHQNMTVSVAKAGAEPTAPPHARAPTVDIGSAIVPASSGHGASGLLTLIATVGVVGVSAAAIRAIIAQRATRAFAA